MKIVCPTCSSKMNKKSTASSSKWVIGVIVFLLGIAMLPILPLGTIFGVIMIWSGNRLQKGKKYYLCSRCGNTTN